MKQILSIEELREALTAAKQKADETDAALQAFDSDGSEEANGALEELEARWDSTRSEVERLAKAVARKEQMNAALRAVPEPPKEEDRKSFYGDNRITNEPLTYRKNGPNSFFKDVLYATKEGDPAAAARLQRHEREMKVESRAMTSASGSGIGFVAPQYLQDEWAELARAGRPLADAIGARPLPATGVSFNVPRITTGSSNAVQANEGDAVQDNSPVSDTISLSVSAVAGKVDMSRQLFDRSDPAMEAVVGADLAASYALKVDSEIINGTGSGGRVEGILESDGIISVAVSAATAVGIYPKVADAIQQVDTNRYLPPSLIAMHPRRWAQFLAALDTNNRPLVVPNPAAVNPLAAGGAGPLRSQGFVGYDLQGLPVLKDANIPTNLGAGTNEDRIIILRREDMLFFESEGGPFVRVYEEVLSGTLQVRILAFGYIAFTAERQPKAVALLTGLTPPSF